MQLVTSERARAFIEERGGEVWVWLDPRRALVGSYVWLEAHPEPPGASRHSSFTRSSRRPHRFRTVELDGIRVHYDFGHLDPPEQLHLDRKGFRRGGYRLAAYWNGSVFVDPSLPPV
jgi:hypothetical protein